MWVATADFMNAFDSISHESLWNALEKCGIESHYICLLRRLYAEQKGSVSIDNESAMFEVKNRERHRVILGPAYSSTRCSMWHWEVMWNGGKKNKGYENTTGRPRN